MDAYKCLNQYYSEYDEDGRLLSRHGQVEYLTTMRYIHKYLKPGMGVLEIGAGTGRYSHALAREGYPVDAVELIQHNIDVFESRTEPGEEISIRQGNATNLSFIGDETYDMTLLLGPMYHLFSEENKIQALSEAIRVTKRGGIVCAAYCMSDGTIYSYGFKQGQIFEPARRGLLDDQFNTVSHPEDLFELHRKEDIDALMKDFDVERLHYVATDLMTNHMRETVDGMDDGMYEMYLKYHFAVCERRDMVGITHHSLDLFRKK